MFENGILVLILKYLPRKDRDITFLEVLQSCFPVLIIEGCQIRSISMRQCTVFSTRDGPTPRLLKPSFECSFSQMKSKQSCYFFENMKKWYDTLWSRPDHGTIWNGMLLEKISVILLKIILKWNSCCLSKRISTGSPSEKVVVCDRGIFYLVSFSVWLLIQWKQTMKQSCQRIWSCGVNDLSAWSSTLTMVCWREKTLRKFRVFWLSLRKILASLIEDECDEHEGDDYCWR